MLKEVEKNLEFRKKEIAERFKKSLDYELNLDDPKTFNEKIQWLKLYNHDPLMTKCADKYLAREYIKEKIGKEYLTPLLGVWDNPDDIDFDSLPNQFVLKLNWGYGQNIIVKDKSQLDINQAKGKLRYWLQPLSNHYYGDFEWGYKNIPPKIICEKYIEQLDGNLFDYKVFCFNGIPKYIQVDLDRFTNHSRCIYDTEWNKILDLTIGGFKLYDKDIEKPKNLDLMLELSKKLSSDFYHVRVDWFIIDEKLHIGELTFTHGNGNEKFSIPEWDYKFGELLKLPKEKRIEYDTLTREELISQACNLEYISRNYKRLQNEVNNLRNKINNDKIKKFILFGIENSQKALVIYFFGIKISIKKKISLNKSDNIFYKHEVRNNSILIVEANNTHGETLPSFIKYFQDLNYNVDIILNTGLIKDKVFDRFNFANINIFTFNRDQIINEVLISNKLKEYKYVFYNTIKVYLSSGAESIFQYNKKITNIQKNIIAVDHTVLAKIKRNLPKKNIITLLPNISGCLYANPHYFGNNSIKDKNQITKFAVFAREKNSQKNIHLIIDSIKKLIVQGVNNFKLIIVGRVDQLNIDISNFTNNIEFTGYLDYQKLYQKVEESDFILPMLDPNIEDHKRFLEDVSGSFQLVYGFGKIPIIHSFFSERYGFNKENALIYNNDDELIENIQYAINMTNDEYVKKSKMIFEYSDILYKESLENLKYILEK